MLRTNSGSIDHDAKAMHDDCEMALMEVNSGVVAMGLYTSCIVLMDENLELLKNSANYIQKALGAMGFPSRIEDVNTMDAFFGTLPGHGVPNLRRAMMNTRNVADLMPTSSIWTVSHLLTYSVTHTHTYLPGSGCAVHLVSAQCICRCFPKKNYNVLSCSMLAQDQTRSAKS